MSYKQSYLINITFTIITLIFLFYCLPVEGGIVSVSQVRYWTAPDHTRVVIDIDNPTYFRTYSSEDKTSILLNLKIVKTPLQNILFLYLIKLLNK